MALRIYNVDLSPDSIDRCIKNLKEYRKSLDDKLADFVDGLCKIGLDSIDSTIAQINPNDLHNGGLTASKKWKRAGYGQVRMEIHLSGEDVLFIEFSAGITYGTKDYPLDSGSGYGMGTYNPSSDNWSNPEGWWYTDESGQSKHTYGNRAYMPMYHATEAIAIQVWMMAMKTFGV